MLKVEAYNSFDQKKGSKVESKLSKEDALVRTLELMDFYSALSSGKAKRPESNPDIKWIELQWKTHDK